MLRAAFGAMFLLAQLSGPGGGLPQILQTDFKPVSPIKAGVRGEVAVTFTALKGYAVDRTLPMTLKLTPVSGVALAKTELKASPDDPKAKDQYYVDLPVIKVPVTATQADLESAAKASEKVKPFLDGKTIKKIIVVPKKLINIVVS